MKIGARAAPVFLAGVALMAVGSPGFGMETSSPTPSPAASARTFVVDDAAVARALGDELGRSMTELKLADSPRPYYLAYQISDVQQASAAATFGAITSTNAYRGRTVRTDVRVGDPTFDNGNTAESMFGGNVDSLPVDDDYPALRRELWLRTDEAYKAAVETLAKKRSAAAGQASRDEDGDVPDFSSDKAAKVSFPFAAAVADPAAVLDTVKRLSAALRELPELSNGRVTATIATVRRRFVSSEGASSDETRGTVRVDAVAETQADDGMRLVDFVTFTALAPSGLPPVADMVRGVRKMAAELVAMRKAPIAQGGVATILFEGPAAGQIVKLLIGDNLAGTPAPRTAAGAEERSQSSEFADRLGQKVASPLVTAVDDPGKEVGPGKAHLFGAYHVDDEGIAAERVSLIEGGILKGLLMTRTPRKEIRHSNGHARATRFGGPRALVGNLFVSGKPGAPRATLSRAALIAEMARAVRAGGLQGYVVRLLDDPNVPGVAAPDDMLSMISLGGAGGRAAPVKPLVVTRVTAAGKEEPVRGLTLEGVVARSLKDVSALGRDPVVYNYQEGGAGFVGVPSSIVTPPLLFSDVDVRRSVGKNKRPPLYPRPGF